MSALWTDDGSGWNVLAPAGFPDEETLRTLIEKTPEMLPLAGAPTVAILGREVWLPNVNGSADLIGVELSGQPVFIEVKLARNHEARRAVVAQVLSYAAAVHGLDVDTLESQLLMRHLRDRGYLSIADAARAKDTSGQFEAGAFASTLAECLAAGTARLVLVLDEAPRELLHLAAYLEAVTDRLVVDLITVTRYEIGDEVAMVPRRVDPGREREEQRSSGSTRQSTAQYLEGADEFVAAIETAPEEHQPELRELVDWARSLERDGLADLGTTLGKIYTGLRVRLPGEGTGPVTIWKTGPTVQLWGSVLHTHAPNSVPEIEKALAPIGLRPHAETNVLTVTPELLDALTAAYREAAVGRGQ